uniref:Uncharacterized protein n=1 Tax=Ditylenchus dipsaci TaxID=166011 RepID=A0A915DGL3_9BILA
MAVAGPDYRFHFLSAKWPGSVNDARVLRNSAMAARLNKKEKLRELRLKNRSLQLDNYEKEKRLGLFPGVVIPGAYDEEDVDDSEFMKLIGKELGDESFEKYF